MRRVQAVLLSFLLIGFLGANPQGAQTVSGKVTIQTVDPKNLQIQASDRAIIHWKDFSIAQGESTRFIQPSAHASVLNRVTGNMPSHLNGLLQANGKIYLINPQGILIGKEGRIDTAGFLASTLDLLNEDFLKGRDLLFSGSSKEGIINLGTVEAWDGDVLLLGHYISDEGTIRAPQGIIGMGAGQSILIKPHAHERLYIIAQPDPEIEKDRLGIETSGALQSIQAELKADGNAYAYAIKQKGRIEAITTEERGGRIWLVADKGQVTASGTLVAQKGEKGGEVHLLGERIGLLGEGKIDVSGKNGGGTVLLGGDFQGKNPEVPNSQMTLMEKNCYISADAKEAGDGGKVILWSDSVTGFFGNISARGGELQGDGGFVEVSGKGLPYFYEGDTDTRATNGKTGRLLMDPTDIQIIPNPPLENNINLPQTGSTFSATPDVPSTTTATLTPTRLVTQLGLTDVIVTTASQGTIDGKIAITAGSDVVWTSNNSLTLISNADMQIEASLDASGGGGSITLIAGTGIGFGNSSGNNVVVTTSSGNIEMTANTENIGLDTQGGSLTITTGSGNLSINVLNSYLDTAVTGTLILGTTSGNLNINTAGNIFLTAGGGPAQIVTGSGSNVFNIGGDLLVGQSGSTALAQIGSSGGVAVSNMQFSVGGNVVVQGGSAAGSGAQIGHTMGTAGATTLNIGGNLSVLGGTASNAYAQIGNTGATGSNNLQLTVGGNVSVQGGSISGCSAQIGHMRGTAAGSITIAGDIIFNAIGGNVSVLGGTAANNYAQIGHINGSALGSYVASGNVTLNNIFGSVALQAGSAATSSAIIGHGNFISPGGDQFSGNISLEGLGAGGISIQASNFGSAIIGFFSAGSNNVINSNLVSARTFGPITLSAANGQNAVIGYYDLNAADTNNSALIGQILIEAGFDLTLNAGNNGGTNAGAAIIGTDVVSGAAQSSINISCRDLFLNGPSASNDGLARITNQIIGTSAPFDVQINSRNAFIGNGNGVGGSTEIFSSRNLTMISNSNTILTPSALVHNVNGNLTIVVDNDFPNPPNFGTGQFVYQEGAVISSNGPVRIFTATRAQNSIQGLLNGAAFVPGPLFIDSATEEWAAYFSEIFSGVPFTIYYKDELPAYTQRYGVAISEFFQDIKTYDDWVFAKKFFCEGYDEHLYECQEYPASALTSEEIICDEKRVMIQRKYRTYQTKFVKSF